MMRPKQIAAFVAASLIWGSEWLVVREIEMPPLAALAVRCAFAAALLALVGATLRLRLPHRRQLLISAVTGVTLIGLPAILTIWASRRISPGLLTVVLAMTPLIAALLEGRAEGAVLVALVGGVGGAALLASQGLSLSAGQVPGALGGLAAAIFFAGSVVSIKRKLREVHPLVLAGTQLAAAALCCVIASVASEGREALTAMDGSIAAELALGAAGSALAYSLYSWLVKEMESFQLTASQWGVTVAGVAEGLVLLREKPSWRMVAGGAIMLISLAALLKTTLEDEAPLTIQ